MRKLFYFCLFFFPSELLFGQGFSVNTTGTPAHSSAMLDVNSTDRGFLIPRMLKAQKNSIVTPATGLLIYQNGPDSIGFHYYDGTAWRWLISNTIADTFAWRRSGNAGTFPSVNFVGTTDNNPLRFRINNLWAGQLDSSLRTVSLGLNAGTFEGPGSVTIGNAAGRLSFSENVVAIGDSAGYYVNGGDNAVYIGNKAGRNYLNFNEGFRSVVIGNFAGDSAVANWTTIIGNQAARRNRVWGNTFIGSAAGELSTTGIALTFIGNNAGRGNNTGSNNTFVGNLAGFQTSTGSNNTFMGSFSGRFNGASQNTGMGDSSLYSNSVGFRNTAVGNSVLRNNLTGLNNTAVGSVAMYTNLSGNLNIAMGDSSLYSNNSGSFNVGVGSGSLRFSVAGSGNTAIGYRSLYRNVASFNTSVGLNSMSNNNTGSANTAVGVNSLGASITGSNNTIVGFNAMDDNVSGNDNTIIGNVAFGDNISGNENVAVGSFALNNAQGSTGNTAIGFSSLNFFDNNVYSTGLGYGSQIGQNNLSNATAIGAYASADTSNALVLGSSGGFLPAVNVGIGVNKPFRAVLNIQRGTANGTTLGIFGLNTAGVSIQQNFPTIGFNQYRDNSSGNTARFMSNGYALNNYFDPAIGTMIWNMSSFAGTANAFSDEVNKMILTRDAYLGLGNTGGSPRAYLHIENTVANRKIILWESANNQHQYFGFGIEAGALRYAVPGAGDVHRFYAGTSATTSNLLFTIFGTGNATLAGTLTQLSDARLKKNIHSFGQTLANLTRLTAYNYQWKDEMKDQSQQVGLLAQEVEKLFPQLVKKDENGMLSVNYNGFVPLIIEALKEQQQQIKALKMENQEIKTNLQAILCRLAEFKKQD